MPEKLDRDAEVAVTMRNPDFPILSDSTPVDRLRVCVVVCSVFQSGG